MRVYLVLRELNVLQELELCPLGPLELPQRGPNSLVVLPVVVDGVRDDETQVERGGVYSGGGGLLLPALATRVAPGQLQGIQAQVSAGQQEQEQQGLHRGVPLLLPPRRRRHDRKTFSGAAPLYSPPASSAFKTSKWNCGGSDGTRRGLLRSPPPPPPPLSNFDRVERRRRDAMLNGSCQVGLPPFLFPSIAHTGGTEAKKGGKKGNLKVGSAAEAAEE